MTPSAALHVAARRITFKPMNRRPRTHVQAPMRTSFRILALSALSALLGAPAHAGGGLSWQGLMEQAERAAANAALPVAKENQLGKKLAKETEKENELHKSKEVQQYVAKVGKKVAAEAKDTPKGIKYTFKVIDDDETINAFALPGGHIYVYTGLLKLASDEAELASVLGHEVAHVSQRHIAERLIAAVGLETLLEMATGKRQDDLAGLAGQLAGQGALMSFGREQESDADAHGLPYSVAAGYDPNGFVRLFGKLAKGEGPKFLEFLQSHPLPSERIEDAKAQIAKLKKKPDKTNEAAYQKMLEKL